LTTSAPRNLPMSSPSALVRRLLDYCRGRAGRRRLRRRAVRPGLEALESRLFLSLTSSTLSTVPALDPSLAAVHLDTMRAQFPGIDGSGIGIAVLDTGIAAANPDLQGNVKAWYDAVDPANTTPIDPVGHGSLVAGIAASSNPSIGVAPGANLIAVRVVPGPGDTVSADDATQAGLQWVLDHRVAYNIQVVNLSLADQGSNVTAPPDTPDGVGALIQELEQAGVTVVIASGND